MAGARPLTQRGRADEVDQLRQKNRTLQEQLDVAQDSAAAMRSELEEARAGGDDASGTRGALDDALRGGGAASRASHLELCVLMAAPRCMLLALILAPTGGSGWRAWSARMSNCAPLRRQLPRLLRLARLRAAKAWRGCGGNWMTH